MMSQAEDMKRPKVKTVTKEVQILLMVIDTPQS